MKEPSFPCCFRFGTCMITWCDFKATAVKRISLHHPVNMIMNNCIHGDYHEWQAIGIIIEERVVYSFSDEMEDYGVPKSGIRSLRGYYAFNADNKPGADQSKEDKQGNTKKRQVELESCGNSERRVGGGSPVWCHYSRCQQHHQGAGWRAKWNAGASPCTDGIIGKECVRRHYGTRMEGVQYLTWCLPMMMFTWTRIGVLPSSIHSCSFCSCCHCVHMKMTGKPYAPVVLPSMSQHLSSLQAWWGHGFIWFRRPRNEIQTDYVDDRLSVEQGG